jgi:ABC-type polysaccharide/polyol phosphate export permease
VIVWILGATPGLHLGWLVLALLLLFSFTVGLALALSALNLFFHDVRYFFDAGLLIWFYATPIVYPAEVIPERYAALVWLNPLHWLVAVLRAPLYEGRGPSGLELVAASLVATASLVLGWLIFSRLERRFHLYL